jgi:hypothetical protein
MGLQPVAAARPPGSKASATGQRETFVDPYTARIVGSRKFGELAEGKKNLLHGEPSESHGARLRTFGLAAT